MAEEDRQTAGIYVHTPFGSPFTCSSLFPQINIVLQNCNLEGSLILSVCVCVRVCV